MEYGVLLHYHYSHVHSNLVWFGLFLWHINHCRLFNDKTIFIHKTVLFQTIQFSISLNIKNSSILSSFVKKVKWFQVLLCITNNSINHQTFIYTQLNVKTVLFQTIQFNISIQFSSIWPIDRTLSDATTLGQNRTGSNGNKVVLYISQSSSITGASPSECLVSYPWHSLRGGGLTSLQRCTWCIL